jgi:hypothetical protein
MREPFVMPIFRRVQYRINQATGYYTKTDIQPERFPVMRLPYELKRTTTQAENIKINARELMVSREKFRSGKYKFITGLHEIDFNGWEVGNDYEMIHGEKVLSIVLFHFSQDRVDLNVYYFGRFDVGTADRRREFANLAVPRLLKPLIY